MRISALVLAALVAVWSSSASAIDFTQILTDLDGKPVKNSEIEVTLGAAATHALLTPFPDEQNLSGEEKVKRFLLATKVREAKDVKLTIDELNMIKKLVGKAYAPLLVGRIWEIIDPASVEKK